MSEIDNLKAEIAKLKERNKRVEANKAWETSTVRKLLITVLTYFVMGLIFTSMGSTEPWKNAIIPTLGFVLSTLSLDFAKDIWEKQNKKDNS